MDNDLYREQVEEGRRRERMDWADIEKGNACGVFTEEWGGQNCLRVKGHEGAHAAKTGDLTLVWGSAEDLAPVPVDRPSPPKHGRWGRGSIVYLAGPMSNLPDYNYPAFHNTTKALREQGFIVFNPAENHDGRTDLPLEEYYRTDIPQVCDADAVAVLPGWESSGGAKIEVALARQLGKPVIDAITLEEIPAEPDRHPASAEFHRLLTEIGALHDRKQRDYGSSSDPFANVRASQEFGVPAWVGALIRLNDKVTRLKSFATRGELANESAEDSMLDIAVYALIALILYREPTDG